MKGSNMAKNDLLDGLGESSADEVIDLLGGMSDEGAPAWVPEEAGEGIQGTLVAIDSQPDQYGDNGETVPVWTVQLDSGDKVRVLGFGSVLRREMTQVNDAGAKPGDTIAVKFFGEKEILKGKWKGKMYKHYKAAHRAK